MSKDCRCILKDQIEVPYEGNLKADIIFILESPGREELRQKRPAVGDAGQQWEYCINEVGFKREEVFIINPCRCRLDKQALGATKIKQIIAACRPALVTAVQHIKPKIIVCCGGIASYSVVGVPIAGVKARRGRWEYSSEFNCQVLHTFHPSFTLRDPSQLPYFKQDMKELRRVVDNNFDSKRNEKLDYKEVDSIQFLLDQEPEVVGFDTETQGLKWFDDDFILISHSISDEQGKAYQIVLWEEGTKEDHFKQIVYPRNNKDTVIYIKKAKNHDQKITELKEFCGNENIKKYVMTSYDEHVMEAQGITDQKGFVLDVQIGAHILNSDVYRNANLADLEASFSNMDSSYNYTFADTYKKEDMLWSLKQDRDAFNFYSCADSDGVRRVGLKVKEELMKNELEARYYVKMVHPITKNVLYNISKNGMLVDVEKLPQVSQEIILERDRLEAECLALIPEAVKNMERHKNQLLVKGTKRPLNRGLLISDTLFSEHGFGLKPLGYAPKTGNPKTDQKTLAQVLDSAPKQAREFLKLKFERDEYHTAQTRYIKNITENLGKDNRVHPSMSTTFTVTGRAGCIRKGTPIEIVRDVDKFPGGIPIENVKVGSWAYSFDDKGQPCIKKVIGKQCTGIRKIIRVHWKNQPNSQQGYLDLTPEHKVRLANGNYIEAINLESNMSVCSLCRCRRARDNRSRLFLTNKLVEISEHRFVFSQIHGSIKTGSVVHHKDSKRNNHVPDNLEQMGAGEHSRYHNKIRERGPTKLINTLTPFRTLYLLAKAKGYVSKTPYAFETYKPILEKYGIDFNEVHKRYNTKGEYLSKGKIKKSLAMLQKEALQWLGINYYKWQYLIKLYGFVRLRKWKNQRGTFVPRPNNHLIDRVEILGIEDEVWDLEIEGTHNFVAGNLSVHNSRNPNTMNIIKRGRLAKTIRSLFIAPPGSYILNVDASQCLVPETHLITIDGIKELKEVVENKIPVLSCNKENKLSFQSVLNAWSSGIKEIWRLTFEDGSYVDCSSLHRFKTYEGEFKKVDQMIVGDRFTHVHSAFSCEYPAWYVGCKRSMPGHQKTPQSYHRKHRLAGAFVAGRPLSSKDFIHHKDKNKENWMRSNLELLDNSSHAALHNKGEGNPRWGDKTGEDRICPVCGKLYYVYPSQTGYVTCSKKCAAYFFHVQRRIQKICPVCGGSFAVVPSKEHRICCSSSCATAYKTVTLVSNHKLISKQRLSKRETFQIEVANNHTYILANGLVSKNSELRWIAHESQDKRLLEAYRNGEDLHAATGLNMLLLAGKKPEDITKAEMKDARQRAKPKNFGLSFGMSAFGYKRYALDDFGIKMTQAQANEDRNAWFALYPGVAAWHERVIQEMYQNGGVRHAFGRFRHLPNLFSKEEKQRRAAEREGINDKIQGPSSDAVLLAGSNMYKDKFIDRPEIKLINFVHDNLMFEVRGKDSYIESLAREVVDRMSVSDFPDFGFSLSVPMAADAELGTNLADLVELKL